MALTFTPLLHDPRPRIAFRADGNTRIGLGHLTRCQALAELLVASGWDCLLLTREDVGQAQWFQHRSDDYPYSGRHYLAPILRIPAEVALADEPAWIDQNLPASDILVLDGYSFDPAYQRRCKQSGRALVCFDDFASGPVWADVIINTAGGVVPARYQHTLPGAQFCLGPDFALLRPAFWKTSQKNPTRQPNTNRLLLSMGGADPDNHTLRLAQELQQRFPDKHISVVTGAAYPHLATLQAAAQAWPNVRLQHNLAAGEMAELMRSCGLYVCPPSGLAYECCAMGGLLMLFQSADNQQLVMDFLLAQGLALPYTALAELLPEQLPDLAATLRHAQQKIFDYAQIKRNYYQVFKNLGRAYYLRIRRAKPADATLYFNWANDATVRANAINPAPIAWPGHLAWFGRRLADPSTYLYLLAWEGQLIGQVRIEFEGPIGTIDYSVDAAWRGRGFGLAMLRRTLAELWRERPGTWRLHAEVQAGNTASARVFERLHFSRGEAVLHGGQPYEVFELAVNSAL